MRNNLGLYLAKRAQLCGNVEALVEVERGRRFTFSELNARCNRIAHVLLNRGVAPGDRVAFLLMNGVEYIEAYFAVAKIGAVMVPLNWRLLPEDLAFILKDSGSTSLIYDQEFDSPVNDLRGLDTDLQLHIRIGDSVSVPDFAVHYDNETNQVSDEEPEINASGDDLLFIMYTSGTTGLPKGAVHTHNTMFWASTTFNMTIDTRYRDRYMQMLPLFHVGALMPLTVCVHRGMTCISLREFDPARAWRTIETEQVNVMLAVPSMLQFMLQTPDFNQYDRSELRWILSGAAPVPVNLIQAYSDIGIEVHQAYGLTESCGPACVISPEEALNKAGSCGPAFLHTSVRVIGEDGRDIQSGEIGEVIISSPHNMREYWNRPDATADSVRENWLYTGDLATVDDDSFVYIQDRKKDMIISGGENIYPAEIENVLVGHPQIVEAAVIGQASSAWGESPAAVVVVKKNTTLLADEVLSYCGGKLARFKQPKAVEFVDEIPRNPSGKVLKRILREQFPGPAPE